MSGEIENLLVGAFGWHSTGWEETFYPEDMPQDWRLDYYSQYFQTVLVPYSEWRNWTATTIEELVASLEEAVFYWVFDLPESLDSETDKTLRQIKAHFQASAYGILYHGFKRLPEELTSIYQVTYLADESTFEANDPQAGGLEWMWRQNGLVLWGAPLGYVSDLPDDGRAQADLLRKFMASLPESCQAGLFLVGNPHLDMAQLKNLKVVAELLGY